MSDPAPPPYPDVSTQDEFGLPLPSQGMVPDNPSETTNLLPYPTSPNTDEQRAPEHPNLPYSISPNVTTSASAPDASDTSDPPSYRTACRIPSTAKDENGPQPPPYEAAVPFQRRRASELENAQGAWNAEGLFPGRKSERSRSTGI